MIEWIPFDTDDFDTWPELYKDVIFANYLRKEWWYFHGYHGTEMTDSFSGSDDHFLATEDGDEVTATHYFYPNAPDYEEKR